MVKTSATLWRTGYCALYERLRLSALYGSIYFSETIMKDSYFFIGVLSGAIMGAASMYIAIFLYFYLR